MCTTSKDYKVFKLQLRSDWNKTYDLMEKTSPEEELDRGLFESLVNFFMGTEVYEPTSK